jgi:hypothetical protein
LAGCVADDANCSTTADSTWGFLTAYDLYLRAYAMVLSSARQVREAFDLMEQAIARDPHYGPALAWAALCGQRLVLDGRSEDPATDALKSADFARRAVEGAATTRAFSPTPRSCWRISAGRDDGVGRPRTQAQPELRARLGYQRHA